MFPDVSDCFWMFPEWVSSMIFPVFSPYVPWFPTFRVIFGLPRPQRTADLLAVQHRGQQPQAAAAKPFGAEATLQQPLEEAQTFDGGMRKSMGRYGRLGPTMVI